VVQASKRVPGREVTVMGLETEYGILGAEPEDVVAACLEAEGQAGRSRGVRWDYSGEYPLRDARGFEVDRSAVDPSMLTDIPGAGSVEAPVPGRPPPPPSPAPRTILDTSFHEGGTVAPPRA